MVMGGGVDKNGNIEEKLLNMVDAENNELNAKGVRKLRPCLHYKLL